MSDRLKNILIGSFILSALGILCVMVLFLKPTIGDGKKHITVRFANISGVGKGTRVTYAGRPVGEVWEVRETPNARLEAIDDAGRVFSWQLTLRIDSSVNAYTCDEIAVRTAGLMGEKSIGILPKAPPAGQVPQLISDQVIYANSIDPFENTINLVGKTVARIDSLATKVDEWFGQNAGSLARAAENFGGAAASFDTFLTAVQPPLKDSLDAVRTSLSDEALLSRVSALIQEMHGAAEIFNTQGQDLIGNLNEITHELATGKGTVGKFIKGDDFYLRLTSLMNKGETLMNDVNHYGLLFQYNKGWQRSRTKKANLLNALDTPQEFKAYFEGEVDSITTSLGRIGDLLDRAETEGEKEKIVQNEGFKRDFVTLLRQVEGLSSTLKLFNQELVAKQDE